MHEVQSAAADANWKSKQEGKRKAALAYKQLRVHIFIPHSPFPYTLFFPFWIWDNELSLCIKINKSDTCHYIGIRQWELFEYCPWGYPGDHAFYATDLIDNWDTLSAVKPIWLVQSTIRNLASKAISPLSLSPLSNSKIVVNVLSKAYSVWAHKRQSAHLHDSPVNVITNKSLLVGIVAKAAKRGWGQTSTRNARGQRSSQTNSRTDCCGSTTNGRAHSKAQ